jgi:hypothetical protein
MKRNCTTCKKSIDGRPCIPPDNSAAAQWQLDNFDRPTPCLDHEPRPVKHVVRMEIEPYVDKDGKEWCWHSAENCCSYFYDKCPFRDKNHGYGPRPQACIDAEIEEHKQVEESCNTCIFEAIEWPSAPCCYCSVAGNGVLSYWSKS